MCDSQSFFFPSSFFLPLSLQRAKPSSPRQRSTRSLPDASHQFGCGLTQRPTDSLSRLLLIHETFAPLSPLSPRSVSVDCAVQERGPGLRHVSASGISHPPTRPYQPPPPNSPPTKPWSPPHPFPITPLPLLPPWRFSLPAVKGQGSWPLPGVRYGGG